jgi:hypothetical protein
MASDSLPPVPADAAAPRRIGAWLAIWGLIAFGLLLVVRYTPEVTPVLSMEGLR